jgi:hypothetical protein
MDTQLSIVAHPQHVCRVAYFNGVAGGDPPTVYPGDGACAPETGLA